MLYSITKLFYSPVLISCNICFSVLDDIGCGNSDTILKIVSLGNKFFYDCYKVDQLNNNKRKN